MTLSRLDYKETVVSALMPSLACLFTLSDRNCWWAVSCPLGELTWLGTKGDHQPTASKKMLPQSKSQQRTESCQQLSIHFLMIIQK